MQRTIWIIIAVILIATTAIGFTSLAISPLAVYPEYGICTQARAGAMACGTSLGNVVTFECAYDSYWDKYMWLRRETCTSGVCTNGQCTTATCAGTDTSCGIYPNCINCNDQDRCSGGYYNNYYCNPWGTSCDVTATCRESCCDAYFGDTNAYCSGEDCFAPPPIKCYSNSDCGTDYWVNNPYCVGNDVYDNYIRYLCLNAGTPSASCGSETTETYKETCAADQICQNGVCAAQPAPDYWDFDPDMEYSIGPGDPPSVWQYVEQYDKWYVYTPDVPSSLIMTPQQYCDVTGVCAQGVLTLQFIGIIAGISLAILFLLALAFL